MSSISLNQRTYIVYEKYLVNKFSLFSHCSVQRDFCSWLMSVIFKLFTSKNQLKIIIYPSKTCFLIWKVTFSNLSISNWETNSYIFIHIQKRIYLILSCNLIICLQYIISWTVHSLFHFYNHNST